MLHCCGRVAVLVFSFVCVCVFVCVHTCLCVWLCVTISLLYFFVFLTAGLLFCSCTLKLSWNYYIMGHMVGDLDLIGSWVVAYWTPDSACRTLWFGMFDSLARLVPFPGQRPPALGSWTLTMFQLPDVFGLNEGCYHCYAHTLRVGGIKRWCASDVCLSVAYIRPKLRTERPRKTKTGTEVAHVTRDLDTTFKVRRSKVNLQGAGHIVAATRTACYFFQSVFWQLNMFIILRA